MYETLTNLYSSTSSTIISSTIEPIADGSFLWILLVSFLIAFFLAFGIGANDVANSFGTSVGSKVLTLRQACILATVFEITGATLLGYKVSSTIRTGMIDVTMYGDVKLLMLGYLAALFGSAFWNITATLLGLPVSGTHSIVGSIIGFSLVAKGFESIRWEGLIKIVASWFISPILSGIVSVTLYLFIRWYIIDREEPLKNGLKMLPIFYGFTIFINIFSIVHHGPLFLKYITWWIALLIACIVGTVVALMVRIWIVPRLREKILELKFTFTQSAMQLKNQHLENRMDIKSSDKDNPVTVINIKNLADEFSPQSTVESISSTIKSDPEAVKVEELKKPDPDIDEDDDKPEVARIFTFLHILTACFSSFAHGANDTSNAIGPLVAVLMLYDSGTQKGESPWYLLLFGGVGMSIGLWTWGRRVIRTMGHDLTKITPSTGFTAEIGAATTVLMASKIGVPVSTTHCQVGSVVFVGKAMRSQKGVNWRLFINIALSWGLTVPVSGLFSALAMWLLMFLL